MEPSRSSYPSDPVEIIVGEPSYPKPSISGIPSKGVSLGESVSIWCKGQHRGVRFVLNKDGRHFPPVDSDGFGAVFAISNVSREDGGSYSCSYHSRSEPFAVSYPSNPVELVVRDPSLPRPNISLSPTGVTAPGADVTIRCQGQCWDVRFFLHKAGDLNPQRHTAPAGAGAEFRIPTVGRQHGGSYSCSYRPRSEPFVSSEPSEIVQLVVLEPSYPKPNISGIPSGGLSLGAAVTIWCRGQHRGVRFVLNKEGRHYPPVDSDGFEAVFPISNVSREDGGNYSCSYHTSVKQEGLLSIEPSTGNSQGLRPGLPQPSTSQSPLHPGGLCLLPLSSPQPLCFPAGHLISPAPSPPPSIVFSAGKQGRLCLLSCPVLWPLWQELAGQVTGVLSPQPIVLPLCLGVRFLLRKGGAMAAHRTTAPAVDVVEFPICNVRRGDAGSYCCRYRTKWDPTNAKSCPLHPPPQPAQAPLDPTGVTAPGADVTIRCQGQRRDVRFFLHKAGDLNPQRHMDPAGAGAEFLIPTVGRQHGGNYSCSYRPQSEPFVSLQPSDPVELVVAESWPSTGAPGN
uniref:Ig-like domain-containing protein n=1 Tax=Gopherus evgoodei TaxID=1825980 RepID=A0A8C4Y3L0_9SAUR